MDLVRAINDRTTQLSGHARSLAANWHGHPTGHKVVGAVAVFTSGVAGAALIRRFGFRKFRKLYIFGLLVHKMKNTYNPKPTPGAPTDGRAR